MFKKYIVFSLGVILLLIPAQAYAVEEAEEMDALEAIDAIETVEEAVEMIKKAVNQ